MEVSVADEKISQEVEETRGLFKKRCWMYIIYSETDHQPRLDAWDNCAGLVHWEDSEGLGREGGGRENQDGEYM